MYLFSENHFQVSCLFTLSGFNCFYHCFSSFFERNALSPTECLVCRMTILWVQCWKSSRQLEAYPIIWACKFCKEFRGCLWPFFLIKERSFTASKLVVSFFNLEFWRKLILHSSKQGQNMYACKYVTGVC